MSEQEVKDTKREESLLDIITAIKENRDYIERTFSQVTMKSEYDRAMSDLEKRINEIEKRLNPNGVSLPGVNEEKQKFSWCKAAYGISTGDWSESGFEKEVFENTRKRVLATTSGTAGQFLIPTEVSAEIIGMFEASLVMDKVKATKVTDLTGYVEINKQTGGATAYWVGENQDITPSDLTFGQVTAQPKQVAAMVKASNRVLQMANPSLEAMIKRDIALRLALKIDLAALRGTGTSTQPLGVANTPNINTVTLGTDGGNIDFDKLIDMEYALEEDNALFGNLAYVWHPCTRRNLMKLKVAQYSGDTGGQYIVQPVTPSQLQEWIGYPYFQTTQVPTNLTKNSGTNLTEIYYANWAEFMMFFWGGMEIMASQETSDAFQKVQTWIRVIQEVDMLVRHPESFCLINDANKTNS